MISIPDVIQEVQLDLHTLIGESAVKVEVKVADCPQIYFSHKNLKSIIYNLLSNAIKYRSHERSPRVLITCYPESGNIVLMVQDNGLGIKTKDLNKIFSMFTRLHTHVEVSGVGLYLVKRIIDNAGGTLEVESEEGSGSTFKVVFPAVLKPN